MKIFFLLLFVGISTHLDAQSRLDKVNVELYSSMDEQQAIKDFESKYKNTTIDLVEGIDYVFMNAKFDFVKNLILNHGVKPVSYLSKINSQTLTDADKYTTYNKGTGCYEERYYTANNNSSKKIDLANLFIQKGEKPTNDAFESCVWRNEIELFKVLVKGNGNSFPDPQFCEQLMVLACDMGNYDFVNYFLENKVSANSKDDGNYYALFRAVKFPEIFSLLIEKGADYKVVGYRGLPAIMHAAREGCLQVLQILLDKGVNPKEQYGSNGNAIQMAEKFNKSNKQEVVKLLKKYEK